MHTPLNKTRALLFAAIASAMFSAPVFAQHATTQDPVVRHYEIAAGSVEAALSSFAKSSGVIVVFPPELVAGRQSPGLSREADINTALTLLLQGSGLQAVKSEAGSYVLKPVPSAGVGVLKAVKVTAAAERSNSYATEVASIVRGTDSWKEVPQSVTVITSKLIEDQNLTMMSDAMAKAPGIVATTDGVGNPEFRSRGFVIDNYQVDNLGTSYTSTYRPDFDLAIYDRVEVLRGADGLFSAAGEPGGTINLARKRPTKELRSSVSLAYGSWDNSRIEADVGGALALDGKLRGRLVGVWQDREFFYSPADEEKKVIYGILEYDLTPATKISGGISQQHSDGITWMSGLPTYPDGSQLDLPRERALTVDWANRDTTIRETFFAAEHTFNPKWSAKLSAMKQRYDFDYMQLSVGNFPVDPATGEFGNPSAYSEDNGNHSEGVDLSVTGRFDAWNREHKLVAGIDTRTSHGKQMRNNFNVTFPDGKLHIDDFPGLELPEPTLGGYNHGWPAWGAEQEGIYARLDLQTTDNMHVIVGGRYANYEETSVYQRFDVDGNLTASDTTGWRETGIFTPNVAITYDVMPDWTTYASFTEIYKPQNRFSGPAENQSKLDPITGRNYELGVKGNALDQALNISAALYRIERNGEAIQDTRFGEGSSFFLPLGKIMSEGLDLEVSGEVAPGWEVFAGYTYNRNKNEVSDVVYSALTPKHIFKLWTDYNFLALPQLTLGGGVTAKSEHANTGTYWLRTDTGWTQPPFEIKQGGYAIWDAHMKYQLGDKWNLALNINNLFDQHYYATLGQPNSGNWYGTPRSATVTLRGEF